MPVAGSARYYFRFNIRFKILHAPFASAYERTLRWPPPAVEFLSSSPLPSPPPPLRSADALRQRLEPLSAELGVDLPSTVDLVSSQPAIWAINTPALIKDR